MGKTIEEKARAYDKAIEKLRSLHDDYDTVSTLIDIKEELEHIFPELKESEDEKVRKTLIELVKCNERSGYTLLNNVSTSSMLDWLEKQELKSNPYSGVSFNYNGNIWGMCARDNGVDILFNKKLIRHINDEKQDEQKSAAEPKFKIGDWVVWDNKMSCYVDNIYQGKESLMYTIIDTNNIVRSCSVKSFDNNAHLWSIKDAKPGDVLFKDSICGFTFIYDGINPEGALLYSYIESNDGSPLLKYNIGKPNVGIGYATDKNILPATKEQRDMLFQKMKETGYIFDFESKELKKIEDEEYDGEDYGIDSLYHAQRILEKTLGSVDGYQTDDGILSHKCAITAVKKLYEQKPAWSEEDELQMQGIIDLLPGLTIRHNWLKSLKERIQPKQQDWSEEDEKRLKSCLNILQSKTLLGNTETINTKWLKSFKQRYTWKPSEELDEASYRVGIKRVLDNPESYGLTKYNWKPSEEQLYFLHWLANNVLTDGEVDKKASEILNTLYDDLKKLKGDNYDSRRIS